MKCQGSIPRERIREPRSRCGASPGAAVSWAFLVLARSSDGTEAKPRLIPGGEPLGGQNKVCAAAQGWALCPRGCPAGPGGFVPGDTLETGAVPPRAWMDGGNDPSAGAPTAAEGSVHAQPPAVHPLPRRCNQPSNQLGKLAAGVSHFLLLAAKPACVNSASPRNPGLLHLWGFFVIFFFFPQRRKGLNYEKAEEFLVIVGMLYYCRHQNNFAKCGRILVVF